MQLYERGAFHMSDPITEWLPELNALTVLTEDEGECRLIALRPCRNC